MNIVVYTCITGGKDSIKAQIPDVNATYICFTDIDRPEFKNGWLLLPIVHKQDSPRKTNRYYKTNTGVIDNLIDYDYSIYIDGSIELLKTPTEIVTELEESGDDIMLMKHWVRNCPYQEAAICRKEGLDTPENIDNMVMFLQEKEYPKGMGLHCGGFIVRKPSLDMLLFNDTWWGFVMMVTIRDQLSLNYCLKTIGLKVLTVDKKGYINVGRHSKK